MYRKIKKITIILILICFITAPLHNLYSQVFKKTSELYYTYIGITAGGGLNRITYKDWMNDKQDTEELTGNYFSGGFLFNIFVNRFLGDFRLQYVYNKNSNYPIQHLYFSAAGRFVYAFNPTLSISSGPGIYFDSPPSTKSYDGSPGFQMPLGLVINIGFDTKLFFDLIGRYGSYGIGEESRKLSYGANLGFLYKVGRI